MRLQEFFWKVFVDSLSNRVTQRDLPRVVVLGSLAGLADFYLTRVARDGGTCSLDFVRAPDVALLCGSHLFVSLLVWIPLAFVVALMQVDERGLPDGLTWQSAIWPAVWMFGVVTFGIAIGNLDAFPTTNSLAAPLRLSLITLALGTGLYMLRRREV